MLDDMEHVPEFPTLWKVGCETIAADVARRSVIAATPFRLPCGGESAPNAATAQSERMVQLRSPNTNRPCKPAKYGCHARRPACPAGQHELSGGGRQSL